MLDKTVLRLLHQHLEKLKQLNLGSYQFSGCSCRNLHKYGILLQGCGVGSYMSRTSRIFISRVPSSGHT